MDGKWHQCTSFGKNLSSYHSLWRHKKICQSDGQKRSASSFDEIPTFDGSEFGTGKPKSKATLDRMERSIHGGVNAGNKGALSPLLSSRYNKNPKIRKLVDALVNDDEAVNSGTEKKDDFQFGFNSMEAVKEANNRFSKAVEPMRKKAKDDFHFGFNSMAEVEKANKRFSKAETMKKKRQPKTDDIDFGFKTMEEAEKANELLVRKENDDDDTDDDDDASMGTTNTTEDSDDDDDELPQPPPEVVNEVFHSMIESMPRTKEDITGWCSEEEDEDPRIEDMGPLAKELYNRFKILHCQFLNKGHYEHRNDLMFLLNEMLKRGFIDQKGYEKGVASLDVDIPADSEEEDAEETFEKLRHSTLHYLIAEDKEELRELLKEFKEETEEGDEYTEDVSKLEELTHAYFLDEFLEGKPIQPMIEGIMRRLESSSIAKSSQLRFKTLLKDVNNNRHRVYSILQRIKDADDADNILLALQQLAREELLSEEQYQKIAGLEEITLPIVADIIKESKVGQGLKCLPRTVVGLSAKIPLLVKELKETGHACVRNELAGVLEELYRQEGIPFKQYFRLKKDNNIL